MTKQYHVALSFAGEDRSYVASVAQALVAAGIKVFYDDFEKVSLWGKNLYDYLSDIYRNQAVVCVLFLSEHYARKRWTSLERQSAQARAFTENVEYVLPARFDDTEIPGISPTVGYVPLRNTSPQELARLIVLKLKELGALTEATGIQNVVELNRLIMASTVDPEMDVRNPLRYLACPRCGYTDINRRIFRDRHHGMDVGEVRCNHCEWNDSGFLFGETAQEFYAKRFPGIVDSY